MSSRRDEEIRQTAIAEARRLRGLASTIRKKIPIYEDSNPGMAVKAAMLAEVYEDSAERVEEEFLEGERVDVE